MIRSFPNRLRSQLEPEVRVAMDEENWGLAEADRAVAVSQAISLRRIADLLERQEPREITEGSSPMSVEDLVRAGARFS